jgi:hypothetical protein
MAEIVVGTSHGTRDFSLGLLGFEWSGEVDLVHPGKNQSTDGQMARLACGLASF